MADKEIKRKLAAILSADVKGYSRLMSQDEVGTIRTLNTHREVISDFVLQYKGRVVDNPGDNILAAFESAVNAVNCAVEIQRELAERNEELPSARRMQWRIGINLGDIVEEGDRIYGNGVNIAARIESLTEVGGICISGTIYDQVKDRLGFEYEYLGEQEVKNIHEPVRVYKVLSHPGAAAHRVVKAKGDLARKWRNAALMAALMIVIGIGLVAIWNHTSQRQTIPKEAAKAEKKAVPIKESESPSSEKPSIAVLPFDNMSGVADQEYFSDGLTEEIITRLSMNPMLLVISRNSTFAYKGKSVKIQQVGQELGAQNVLEGSVRKSGNRLRVTAQLIQASTETHLWARTYDRELSDIFALQDDIAQQISIELGAEFTEAEKKRVRHIPTDNLTAYDAYIRGLDYYSNYTKEDNARSREFYQKAIELDPNFADAYAELALSYCSDYAMTWTLDPEALEKAFDLAKKAIALNNTLANGHLVLAMVYQYKNQYEQAFAAVDRALSFSPNDDVVHAQKADILSLMGKPEDAIKSLKTAMRLNPRYHVSSLVKLCRAYRLLGQYDQAIESGRKALARDPAWVPSYWELGLSYCITDQYKEAVKILKEAISIDPHVLATRVLLVIAHMDSGQDVEAKLEAENILEQFPDFLIDEFIAGGYIPEAQKESYRTVLQEAGFK